LTLHPLVLGILIYVCAFVALAVVLAQDWRVLPFLLFPLALTTLGCATSWGEREYVLDRVRAAIGARPT
jgi:hypothetical protein